MKLGMWRKLRVTIVLALTFSAENADSMLLSAMYLAIGTSLGIGPAKLGNLSMFRSLVTVSTILPIPPPPSLLPHSHSHA